MSEERKGPTHRVSFAAFQRDLDDNGERQLGNAREIGAIWERKGSPGDGILRFDHTPREDGIFFVRDLSREKEKDAPKNERTATRGRSRDSGRER